MQEHYYLLGFYIFEFFHSLKISGCEGFIVQAVFHIFFKEIYGDRGLSLLFYFLFKEKERKTNVCLF